MNDDDRLFISSAMVFMYTQGNNINIIEEIIVEIVR